MLLANMAKHPALERLGKLKIKAVRGFNEVVGLELLVDLFNKGAAGWSEAGQSYEYLGYVFADLAKVYYTLSLFSPSNKASDQESLTILARINKCPPSPTP